MRRIVSLDGGGVRGIFSLQVLRQVEAHFRRDTGNPSLVLADVVDLFAGTSTGAIIAACLSWGLSVDDIEALYVENSSRMFSREPIWRWLWAKYRADALSTFFRDFFCESDGTPALLGTSRLRTTLLVVTRNASTGSPWPITNNPAAKYNSSESRDCNLRIPLWRLIRASTAAPTYFAPEEITVDGHRRLFVDGGISPYNNPALIAVLTATLPEYRLRWPASRTDLHVTSIGTGSVRPTLRAARASHVNVWNQGRFLPPALIGAVGIQQDLLCRILGDCLHGGPIDSEIGELQTPTMLASHEQKFTYVRYDMALDAEAHMPIGETRLDNLAAIPQLRQVGAAYAAANVKNCHLYPRGMERPPEEMVAV